MFDIGFTEIIVILGIALVVLGPEKLPKVAAELGRWLGRARAMARQFKAQLDEEVLKADGQWSKPRPPGQPPPWSGEAPPEAEEAGTTAGAAAESGAPAGTKVDTPAPQAPSQQQPPHDAGGGVQHEAGAAAGEPKPAEAAADAAGPPPTGPQADAKTGS